MPPKRSSLSHIVIANKEPEEDPVYFAESPGNAADSEDELPVRTGSVAAGKRKQRPSILRKGTLRRKRRIVHFAESDEEDSVMGSSSSVAGEGSTSEHGAVDEDGVGSGGLSHLGFARNSARSPSLPLFIPERGDTPSTNHSPSPTSPTSFVHNNMDGLNRSRALKAEIKANLCTLQHLHLEPDERPTIDSDPETKLIKELRDEQNMGWGDIAAFLNQERRNYGEAGTYTEASVYSRFVRASVPVAVAINEIGFDPKDYQHMRHPGEGAGPNTAGGVTKAGKKRIKDFSNIRELDANVRKCVVGDELEELETVERTEQLMEAVAKVERNFWVLVAEELERMTTKMYRPEDLADRFDEIDI